MATDGAADLQRWREPPIYRLLSTGLPLEGNHLNKVWRGMCQKPGSTEPGIPMVVKWLAKPEALATELACTLAARALKLQVPAGALVLAERGQLPRLPQRVRGADTDLVMCFGSELQWPDDTTARPKLADAAEEWVWNKLCATAQGPAGGVWDELLANTDRHCENVVFDGNRWWLIDHEAALSSVARVMKQFAQAAARQSVIDEHSKENKLASEVLRRRPSDHKMDVLPAAWGGLRTRLRWLIEQTKRWDGSTRMLPVDNVLLMTSIYLAGIDLRLPALHWHLNQRMQIPAADSLWNSSSNSASAKTPARRSTSRRPRA